MQGDRPRARALLDEARRLDATNLRAVLELSRVLEEAGDAAASLVATCEALERGVTGDDRAELLARRARLVPRPRVQRAATAEAQFALGLTAARQQQWTRAASAFAQAAAQESSSTAALFNQSVALIMAGRQAEAAPVLERYLQLAPDAAERVAIARSFAALRRPTFSPTRALVVGLLPGGGQFTTRRPAAAALVLTAVGGSLAAAWHPVTRSRTIPYDDPNGDPVPYTERYQSYPWRTAGLASAATITILAALEARAFATHSRAPVRLAWTPTGPALRVSLGATPRAPR